VTKKVARMLDLTAVTMTVMKVGYFMSFLHCLHCLVCIVTDAVFCVQHFPTHSFVISQTCQYKKIK